MLKRSLLALTTVAVAATATIAASTDTPGRTCSLADGDGDGRRPDDDTDGRRPPHPPRPPHRRPPPGHGPRCAPPVAAGVLPVWAHEQTTAADPLCVAHNAALLERFDADHNGELDVDEWHAHLRTRHHGPMHHGPSSHGPMHAHNERFALVSSVERQQLVEGANALSHVMLRLPLWFPLWLGSLTTSSNTSDTSNTSNTSNTEAVH